MRRNAVVAIWLVLALSLTDLVSNAPAQQQSLGNVVAIGAGGGHSFAVKKDGTLWAWGYNAHGQIGISQAGTPQLKPVQVRGLTRVSAATGGEFHSLALRRDGTVWAWGANDRGQLGNGTTGADVFVPERVKGLGRAVAIDADHAHSYALLANGTVWAWGENDKGQLGNGTTKDSARPVRVRGLIRIAAIAAGEDHALALTQGGVVYAWGDNPWGQLGTGVLPVRKKGKCSLHCEPSTRPVKVNGLPRKVSAIAGAQLGDYSLALTPDGSVWAWGRNDEGQLGIGSIGEQGCKCSPPIRLRTLTNVKAIAASGGAGAALKSDGTVWAWGNNQFGQLGRGKSGGTNPNPAQVEGLSGVKAIAGGGGFLLALRSDGTVRSWGINTFGELGIGTTSDNPVPHEVGRTAAAGGSGTSNHSGSRIGPISTTTLLIILLASAIPIVAMVAGRRRRPAHGPSYPPGYAASYVPGQVVPAAGFPGAVAQQPGAIYPPAGAPTDRHGAWQEYGRRVLFLSRVDLFAEASRDALAQVAMKLKLRVVPAGGVVCREGEVGDHFFLVEAGTLAVVAEVDGHPRELALLGPGEFFGETALLSRGPRTATIRATTDAQLWALSASDFDDLLAHEPEVAKAVRHAAGQRAAPSRKGLFEIERRNLAPITQDGQQLRLGRSPDNDIVFTSRLVSDHHAVIEPVDGSFRLRDLDSTNGTHVNGVQIRTAELNDGDEIWIADERFVFDSRAIHRSIEPRGIRVDATALSKEVSGGKKVLHDVTLSILPGEFVAIVGGSGTGKTTLMDALSGVRPPTSGQVLYNGRDYYRDLALFRNVLGYVPQDDIIHTGLPLRVNLRHAAKLRLPAETSPEDLNEVVDKALVELELTGQADIKVARLSGGQRKRASIGGELLTEPRIFFLDEPTSGLDPFTDAQMMALLRRLADNGSTVILTTHATKNVMLCDKVVFLARGGHLAFVGLPQRALWYFDAESFDTIYRRLAEGTPEEWAQRFAASEDYRQVLGDQLRASDSTAVAEPRTSLGEGRAPGGLAKQLRQLAVLTRRSVDLLVHNPSNLPSLVLPPILFSVLALALFHSGAFRPTGSSVVPLQILFLLAFSAFIFGLLFGVQEIVKEFPIFRRERLVNLGIMPYVLSKVAILAPLLALLLLAMVGILRLTSRLPTSGVDVYGPLLLTLVLTGLAGLALALLTSAFVSTPQQATDMLSVWIMPQVLFGGALLAVPAMNVIGRIISSVAPVRWSFEALGNIADLTTHFQTDTSQIGPGLAIEYAGSFDRDPAQNWMILALFIVVPLALTCLVLRRKTTAR